MTDNESPPLRTERQTVSKHWPWRTPASDMMFEDGNQYLVAVPVCRESGNPSEGHYYEYSVVTVHCDSETTPHFDVNGGDSWGWDWSDVDAYVPLSRFRIAATPPPVTPPGQQGASAGEFITTEEIDGHRWGKFAASSVLGGKDWEVCFNCGMIRRADKQNSPCKGRAKVGPREIAAPPAAAPAASEGELTPDQQHAKLYRRIDEQRDKVTHLLLVNQDLEKKLAASESARREAERKLADAIEVYEDELALMRSQRNSFSERLSDAQQSAAAMRATITEVIADIDSHYSEVELATGETLIGSWREKLAAVSQPENRE